MRYTATPNTATQMADIHEYIATLHRRRGRPSSGIVYCRARATCDELSAYLRGKGLSARPYHRGIACVLFFSKIRFLIHFIHLFPGSSTTLDKTFHEWEVGGNGEGVDLVSLDVS